MNPYAAAGRRTRGARRAVRTTADLDRARVAGAATVTVTDHRKEQSP